MAAPNVRLTGQPGLYALGLVLPHPTTLDVGALGAHTLSPGYYVYVGSAWGPGGLAARVSRHVRGDGRPHWHVDYLRRVAEPVALWLGPGARDECAWAQALLVRPDAHVVVPRFGASDCNCAAHLAWLGETPVTAELFPSAEFAPLDDVKRGESTCSCGTPSALKGLSTD